MRSRARVVSLGATAVAPRKAVLANVPVAFPESPNLRDSPGVGAARGAPPGGLRKALEEAQGSIGRADRSIDRVQMDL